MPLVNAYATVDEVRDQFGDTGDKLDLGMLERAINAASRAVDKFCGRKFWIDTAPTTRTYRPFCTDFLEVDDIASTTGLTVLTDDEDDGFYSTIWTIDTDYILEPLNADQGFGPYSWYQVIAIGDKTFPVANTRPSVRIQGTFGWSEVPYEVREATILKAVSLFRRKDAPFGVAGFGDFGPVRISRKDPDYVQLLAPYRKMVIA